MPTFTIPTTTQLPLSMPDVFSIVNLNDEFNGAYEWIARGAGMPDTLPKNAVLVKEYTQAVAFAAWDNGNITAWATHPNARGVHAGCMALNACLTAMYEAGIKDAHIDIPDTAHAALHILSRMLNTAAPRNVTPRVIPLWELDVPYFDETIPQSPPDLTVFPAVKTATGKRAAMLVLPGGGYMIRASHEGHQIAKLFADGGMDSFVLSYRLRPYKHPVPLMDAQRAVRVIRSLGYDTVGVIGFSAGGHLCGMVGTHFDEGHALATDAIERYSCRPDAIAPCYAVLSFVTSAHRGSVEALTGVKNPSDELLKSLSAEHCVTESTPPVFMWHTADDDVVPVQNSLDMALALTKQNIPYELHVYPNGPHGLGLSGGYAPVDTWGAHCVEFMRRYLL